MERRTFLVSCAGASAALAKGRAKLAEVEHIKLHAKGPPSSAEVARITCVFTLVTITLTPGMAAPELPVTLPRIVAVLD